VPATACGATLEKTSLHRRAPPAAGPGPAAAVPETPTAVPGHRPPPYRTIRRGSPSCGPCFGAPRPPGPPPLLLARTTPPLRQLHWITHPRQAAVFHAFLIEQLPCARMSPARFRRSGTTTRAPLNVHLSLTPRGSLRPARCRSPTHRRSSGISLGCLVRLQIAPSSLFPLLALPFPALRLVISSLLVQFLLLDLLLALLVLIPLDPLLALHPLLAPHPLLILLLLPLPLLLHHRQLRRLHRFRQVATPGAYLRLRLQG
jgi:hypothetical protein